MQVAYTVSPVCVREQSPPPPGQNNPDMMPSSPFTRESGLPNGPMLCNFTPGSYVMLISYYLVQKYSLLRIHGGTEVSWPRLRHTLREDMARH